MQMSLITTLFINIKDKLQSKNNYSFQFIHIIHLYCFNFRINKQSFKK
jgi:hypothetical protein